MLVLGILMAIAIPLIGGVREAANNAKCRSNLKQLHTAIIAFSTSNEERLPNLQSDLQLLIDGGYIESESKLGICPGDGDKPKLPISSYAGGPDLDGVKKLSSAGINSNTIVLEDAETTYHKAGKNAIRLDGSFTQDRSGGSIVDAEGIPSIPNPDGGLGGLGLGGAVEGAGGIPSIPNPDGGLGGLGLGGAVEGAGGIPNPDPYELGDLIDAIDDGNVKLVDTILNADTTTFDVDAFPPSPNPGIEPVGMNALYLAIHKRNLAIVQTLVNNHDANPNQPYNSGVYGHDSYNNAVNYAYQLATSSGSQEMEAISSFLATR